MTVQFYFTRIKTLLDRYAALDFVLEITAHFDVRPGDQGFLSGVVIFNDQSVLYLREFLDTVNGVVEKIMYSYHYQTVDNTLIFRYDNAAHKPALLFRDHKHLAEQITKVRPPELEEVLAEIVVMRTWI